MATKKELLAQEIARAVNAGRAAAMTTVDFNNPNRPPTCLEVDFPILPVNQVAIIEGNAGKPIYQMSKWWARRRSSVFRSVLIAAATKAPDDRSQAAKLVWDNYYANHQKKGAFKHLRVADIFMGGGTTIVEGSRLGMQMIGNDLNPVAWFVVKQEMDDVNLDEVKALLADIEAEVKPQIMPFYACDGPHGEKGKWTHLSSGKVMGPEFDPLSLKPGERKGYGYQGPEIIYTFFAKHGPCQVTRCGYRTPIMTSPVMAVKTMTVKHWEHTCRKCRQPFHIEDGAARMAPDVPLVVAPGEKAFSVLDPRVGAICPHCGHAELPRLEKSKNKKVELSLLVHPQWLEGSPKADANDLAYGGSAQDDAGSSERWNMARAEKIRLLEVRGSLPDEVTCPETLVTFYTGKDGGTVPKKSNYACGKCGTVQDVLTTIKTTGKTGPMAGYAIQAYSPKADKDGEPYNGRYFRPFDNQLAFQFSAAQREWDSRKTNDLADYWPKSEVPYGFMTHMNNGGIPNHGFTHWWTMFNPRQLLVHSLILKAIGTVGNHSDNSREFVLGAFQQYLRNQNLFCFWDIGYDKLVPHMSNNNYHPKSNVIENCVFSKLGRGNWSSCIEGLIEGKEWANNPWELVSNEFIGRINNAISSQLSGKSDKVKTGDKVLPATIRQGSSTDLDWVETSSIDLVITDPPFGGLLHYSELSDFFYAWLHLALQERYPQIYPPDKADTPKSLEAVANKAREPEDADGFYQRVLTQCWREAHRILKPGGIMAFTFHHSEDEPWVAVLEALFDAGFYLEATYPIRSDETKGEGSKPGTFGSQQIEYDIIHVCRKRTEDPKAVSWGRMRREVLSDVHALQGMLENHAKTGLSQADLQVVRRGKALEYFSRHYGKVFKNEEETVSVREALVGINQIIDEDSARSLTPLPVNSEPLTRQFLRIFDSKAEVPRDQVHKFLRGSGMGPDAFEQKQWCSEKAKVFHLVDPLDFARDWHGRHKRRLTSDLDQALVLIGACYEGSGINASDTLKNDHFKPHIALKALLDWFSKQGGSQPIRTAASRAHSIYTAWAASNKAQTQYPALFSDEELA